MSQQTLEAHYRPNWRLAQAHGLAGYNCGFTRRRGGAFEAHQRELLWRLLDAATIDAGSTVLDVGCGIGGPCEWIWQRHRPARLLGVDYCASSVNAARARWAEQADRPAFLQADAHALPFADGSADVILNLESALHYADKPRFLRECARVLRPGGRLCLGDLTSPRKLVFAPLRLLNHLPTQFNSNLHLWSRGDYERAFPAAGLRLRQHEDVTCGVADSLADGLDEIRGRGWAAARGFRGRFFYLSMLEALLRRGTLEYHLFTLERSAGDAPGADAAIR